MVKKRKTASELIKSSAAEYLTFIAATGESAVEMRYEDENIWLMQKMMAELYNVDVRTVNEHIKKIFDDNELDEGATIRKFRIVQSEGNREVTRDLIHYNLNMTIAVGYKVNNERAVRFRKWSGEIVKQYTILGYVMNVPRFKEDVSALITYELNSLERIVSMYLDYAEDMAIRHIPMTMEDWEIRLNKFLDFNEREILDNLGKVTHEIAKSFVETEFEKYRITQDKLFQSDFDKLLLKVGEVESAGNDG